MIIPGKSYRGALPPLTEQESTTVKRLEDDVKMLASSIEERNTRLYPALIEAEQYIAKSFEYMGYSPTKETYDAVGVKVSNIIAELPGTVKIDEIVVIGAHYDSAPGTPGANDNASAVAGLLEIARALKGRQFERTVRFVAFVNEEPPFTWTELMGSLVHATGARKRNENIIAILCLECLGVYSDKPGSQLYSPPLERFYPDTANFIAFCSNVYSFPLLRKCIKEFRKTTSFPSEGIAAPERVEGISWSDHWSFWKEGYPAIMITDTAFFRYSHYHNSTDTPDKLDYERMARVTEGLKRVIQKLLD